jgi:hypothetical protein
MDANDKGMKTLELADGVRRFEISLFWTRSLFFWGFTTTALASYGAAVHAGSHGLQFGAGCFGLACSVAWTLVNRGSKYWQAVWEDKVKRAQDNAALPVELFSPRDGEPRVEETWIWNAKHFSVSGLAIAFSDFTVLVWLGLILEATSLTSCVPRWLGELAVFIVTLTYVIAVAIFCSRCGWLFRLRALLMPRIERAIAKLASILPQLN